jgi:hypothetical protein
MYFFADFKAAFKDAEKDAKSGLLELRDRFISQLWRLRNLLNLKRGVG